jgi:hypothetical protein
MTTPRLGNARTEKMNTALTPVEAKAVRALAAERGITVSELIRSVLLLLEKAS